MFLCKICGHGFTHEEDFHHHQILCKRDIELCHEESSIENSSDSICDVNCVGNSSAQSHPQLNFVPPPESNKPDRIEHSSSNVFKCRYCKQEFSASHIQNHELTHLLSSKEKPYFCNFCGRCYASQEACFKHEQIHTKPRPFQCPVCNKGFTTAGNLKAHQNIHTRSKIFACETCNKSYTTASNLKLHELIHKREKNFPCSHCGKAFTTAGNLKTHEKVHIGLKPFACHLCEKTFTTAGNLKTHTYTHTREKLFSCHQCDKKFTTAGNLRNHSRTHTGEKPFNCEFCDMTFMSGSSRKSHQKSKHGACSNNNGMLTNKEVSCAENTSSEVTNSKGNVEEEWDHDVLCQFLEKHPMDC